MKQTYFWPMYGDQDEVAFTWSQSRGMAHAQEQLKNFNGTLLTDGYAAYSKTVEQLSQQEQKIVHATCWVHMRRAFEKALDSEPEMYNRHWISSLPFTSTETHSGQTTQPG